MSIETTICPASALASNEASRSSRGSDGPMGKILSVADGRRLLRRNPAAMAATAPAPRPSSTTVLDLVEDGATLADLLLAMETTPLTEPRIWLVTGFDRVCRVAVAVGDMSALLDACDARLAAIALNSEQAFAGCSGVAARLTHEAGRAELHTAGLRRAVTDPDSHVEPEAPHFTGRAVTLSLTGMLLAAVAGAWIENLL